MSAVTSEITPDLNNPNITHAASEVAVATNTDKKRRLKIIHSTTYSYDQPVTKSSHRLHLRPINDWRQFVAYHDLSVNLSVDLVEFEDVFGNFMARFEIEQPYTQLTIRAESDVELFDIDPFHFTKNLKKRPTFPLVWMPWELKMLTPYLAPQELPDTQLGEIYEAAMALAAKNNQDVLETLFALNLMFFKQYSYKPGSTTHATTAFDVLSSKTGVCQDFANLFITMARMLNLPARYVCGYIYTGNTGEARAQSDASHAWVQVYIPQVGWKGFDPTNGILPHLDHVRVGYGRNWRDTAPTSGTLYSSAKETMKIDVQVIDLDRPSPSNSTTQNSTQQSQSQQSSAPPNQSASANPSR